MNLSSSCDNFWYLIYLKFRVFSQPIASLYVLENNFMLLDKFK